MKGMLPCCFGPADDVEDAMEEIERYSHDPTHSKRKGSKKKSSLKPAKSNPNDLGGLDDDYEVGKYLGEGATAKAYLCKDRYTGEEVAVKLISRPIHSGMRKNFTREAQIQAQLGNGHVNIVKPNDIILTRTHLGVVMEYVMGGNLADYVLKIANEKYGSLNACTGLVLEEEEARYYFLQLIDAMAYMHSHNIAHRDLKLDNVMLSEQSDPPELKVIDFGYANCYEGAQTRMTSFIGTLDYMSPQVIKTQNSLQNFNYDALKADVWAAGVLLCVMLTGRFPYENYMLSALAKNLDQKDPDSKPAGQNIRTLSLVQCKKNIKWSDNPMLYDFLPRLSEECKDLFEKIFCLDEGCRLSIAQIIDHEWTKQPLPEKYRTKLQELKTQQKTFDKLYKSGMYQNEARDQALAKMISLASNHYKASEEAGAVEHLSKRDQNKNKGYRRTSLTRISLIRVHTHGYDDLLAPPDQNVVNDSANGKADHAPASPGRDDK